MSNMPSSGPVIRKMTPAEQDIFTRARAMAYAKAPEVAGALFTLTPVYVEGFGTWAVDDHGRIYISHEGLAGTWTEEERSWVFIHEVWHWLRRHPQRSEAVLKEHPEWRSVWAQSVDMEINDDIAKMPGASLPKGCVYPSTHELPDEWTAEKYASALFEKQEQDQQQQSQDGEGGSGGSGQGQAPGQSSGQGQSSGSGDGHGDCDGQCGHGSGGQGQPQPGDGSGSGNGQPGDADNGPGAGGNGMGNCSSVPESWKEAADGISDRMSEGMRDFVERKVAEAIKEQAAKGIGSGRGNLDWAEEKLAPPKVDWRRKMRVSVIGQVIAVKGNARDSYNQPNRRNDSKHFIMPGRRATDPNVLVGIDKSGSMFDGSLNLAINETTGILRARGIKNIRIMPVDTIASEVTTKRGRTLGTISGAGGGTDMREAYYAIRDMPAKRRPTNFILLTDGETPFPSEDEKIPGVYCLAGIITRREDDYERITNTLPSWITTVHIPLDDAA